MNRRSPGNHNLHSSDNRANRPFLLLIIVVSALWFFQFSPIVAGGLNLMGYHLLDPRITGASPIPHKKRLNMELPGRDASLLMTHLPYQTFISRNLHNFLYPQWNPETGCGQPVTSDPQYKPFNPFFWPYFAWPSAWMFSVCIALMALWGMIGFSLYLRELGFSWQAATVGGLLLAWNPLTQQMLILSAPWSMWGFAWSIFGIERWAGRKKFGLTIAVTASALMVYMGHPVISALYFLILICYTIFRPSGFSLKKICATIGFLVAGTLVLTACQVIPFLAGFSQYANYKSVWDGGPHNNWWELSNPRSLIYVPLPIWGLAFAGLVSTWSKRLKLFFILLAVYGILLMFPLLDSGFLRWILSLGGVLVARYGQEAFWLGLLGLSALGLSFLADSWEKGQRLIASRAFLYGALWYFVLAWITMYEHFTLFWPAVFKRLVFLEILTCLPAIVVMLVPRKSLWTRNTALLFCGILLILPVLPTHFQRYFSSVDLSVNPPAIVNAALDNGAGSVKQRISGGRYPNDYLADLCPNQNLAWGLSDIRLTNPIILKRYAEFTQHWNTANIYMTTCYLPRQNAELLRFLGVKWTVRDSKRPDKTLPVSFSHPPLVLQEVEDSVSWVRAVPNWEVAANEPDEFRRTFQVIRTGEWRNKVVLNSPPEIPFANDSAWKTPEISWMEKGPDRWKWTVHGSYPSILVVLQNSHPGWKAEIDGKTIHILKAYGSFMAIEVPEGTHEITFRFRDWWFLSGLVVTLIGWMTTLILIMGMLKRKRISEHD